MEFQYVAFSVALIILLGLLFSKLFNKLNYPITVCLF
jgi:hypothetical protein